LKWCRKKGWLQTDDKEWYNGVNVERPNESERIEERAPASAIREFD